MYGAIVHHSTMYKTEHLSNGLDDTLYAHMRFAGCSCFKQQVTIQRNFVIDSITTTCEHSVVWKAIFLSDLSYAAGGMITHWEKSHSLCHLPVCFVDEQKSDSTCIFTYIFAFVSRQTRREDAVIYFPTWHRGTVFNGYSSRSLSNRSVTTYK